MLSALTKAPANEGFRGADQIRTGVYDLTPENHKTLQNEASEYFAAVGENLNPAEIACVYFVQEENDGPVKIGVASDCEARLRSLQVGNPRRLNLLAYLPMPTGYERDIHNFLGRDKILGEWFQPTEQLWVVLEWCLEHFGDIECTECDRVARCKAAGLDPGHARFHHECADRRAFV